MEESKRSGQVKVNLPSLTNTCFVIMPFSPAFDRVFEKVFKPAIESSKLLPVRADEIYSNRRIMLDVWDSVRNSRCILAELTGKNANVMYELGLCHSLGKPVVIVTSDIADVPFDLRELRCIVYDKNQPDWGELLKNDIKETISTAISSHKPNDQFSDIFVEADFPGLVDIVRNKKKEKKYNLSGDWIMVEEYDHGATTSMVNLVQIDETVQGSMITKDQPFSDDEFIIRQSIIGSINETHVKFTATSYQVVSGQPGDYLLNKWVGTIRDQNTIYGYTEDKERTTGHFTMNRKN